MEGISSSRGLGGRWKKPELQMAKGPPGRLAAAPQGIKRKMVRKCAGPQEVALEVVTARRIQPEAMLLRGRLVLGASSLSSSLSPSKMLSLMPMGSKQAFWQEGGQAEK